jgi:hypothetical protein
VAAGVASNLRGDPGGGGAFAWAAPGVAGSSRGDPGGGRGFAQGLADWMLRSRGLCDGLTEAAGNLCGESVEAVGCGRSGLAEGLGLWLR